MGMSEREESLRRVEGSSLGDWWQDFHVIRITLVGEREEAPPGHTGFRYHRDSQVASF